MTDTTVQAPPLTLAQAQERLSQARRGLADARAHLEALKAVLESGESTVTAGQYAEASTAVDFAELVEAGAGKALEGAQQRHREERSRQAEERQHRHLLSVCVAVTRIADVARTTLVPIVDATVGGPYLTTFDRDLRALQGILHRFVGSSLIGTGPDANTSENQALYEIEALRKAGITLDQDATP